MGKSRGLLQAVRERRLVALVATVLAASAFAVGCGGDESSGGGGDGSTTASGEKPTLRVGIIREPTNLDPSKDSYVPIPRQLWNETLIALDREDGSFGPGLAERFGYVGEGNRAYEITLRRDLKFSDGTPLDAAAVKKWFEHFQRAGGPYAGWIPLRSVETPDERTVRIHLTEASPTVTAVLSSGGNWGAVTKVNRTISTNPIGAGPYKLVPEETVAGDHYTAVPNEHYYDPSKIKWGRVDAKVVKTPNTMLQAMKSGELDVAAGDATTAAAAESGGIHVTFAPVAWSGFHLEDRSGTHARALADPRVRQAINYAVDREAITRAMMGKYAEPLSQVPTFDGVDPEYNDYYDYDPEKARALLEEAGYGDGFSFRLVTPSFNGSSGLPTMQAVARYLADVGIDMQITTAGSEADFQEKRGSAKFSAWQHSSTGNTPMYQWWQLFLRRGGGANGFEWNDPETDRLVASAVVAPEEEGAELWKAVSRRAVEQAYWTPLFTWPMLRYLSDGVGNADATPWASLSPEMVQWEPK